MMRLTSNDLNYLSECAISAAKKAGEIIASYAGKSVSVQHKAGGESLAAQVVTEVDIRSEAVIVEILKPTCDKYELALLTEESDDDKGRLQKDYFWCVDPMDGTLAFTESVPGYSVSIALVAKSGEPFIGVVFDPVTQTLYSAVKGQGVKRNGKPWSLSSKNKSKVLLQICDRGMLQQDYYSDLNKALSELALNKGYSSFHIEEKNGAVLNACTVLENSPAIYFKCPKSAQGGGSVWDFAATAAIFNELGAIATDVDGQPLDLNRADSTYMNHRGVLFTTEKLIHPDIRLLITELCLKN